ncbi:Fic family protein [Leucothrix sargassi]|nr:Fic family protein [Leucothrix sargassi]
MWVWEQENWPNLTYDSERVLPHLEKCVQQIAPLTTLAQSLSLDKRLDWESAILLDETLATAGIEGEQLDRESVRSSIANKLGVGAVSRIDRFTDGLVEVLLQAIRNSDKPLTEQQLKAWHQMMFPLPPIIGELTAGDYRDEAISVQSGRYGKAKIHFEAPGKTRAEVEIEMTRFLEWLNGKTTISGYVRAAIAKFYFVTIHPFDDGNGRLSRIIAERCLAEFEGTDLRLYSLSHVIERRRSEYYDLLEKCQRGTGDITEWVIWFLDALRESGQEASTHFKRLNKRTQFWQQHSETPFNERQLKLLNRLLETGDFAEGISRKKYRALTKASDATAARDLSDLVSKGVLMAVGEGRGRKYKLR